MTAIAPTLQEFFTERLISQRRASPNTVAAYRDAFRLLLNYVTESTGKLPAQLDFDDLVAVTIGAFLTHVEQDRGCSISTRNARLAAVRSMFGFAEYHHPEHAELVARVLAIPAKRGDRVLVMFLTRPEIDALLAAPDRNSWTGLRDYALLVVVVAVQTGLRASELLGMRRVEVVRGHGAHVRVTGKGRKERVTPLTRQTVSVLQDERGGDPHSAVFPGPSGNALGRDAIRKLVLKHARTAVDHCRSLVGKQIGVHTLRYSCAMNLLQAGVDLASIALWLGDEGLRTVQHYLHADLALKERALARATPPDTKPSRYWPPDSILAFLTNHSWRRTGDLRIIGAAEIVLESLLLDPVPVAGPQFPHESPGDPNCYCHAHEGRRNRGGCRDKPVPAGMKPVVSQDPRPRVRGRRAANGHRHDAPPRHPCLGTPERRRATRSTAIAPSRCSPRHAPTRQR